MLKAGAHRRDGRSALLQRLSVPAGERRRVVQLIASCVVLGAGVALLLNARLGSDGFSTLVNGLRLSTGVSFWVVNAIVSVLFVTIAWPRGVKPGLGTLANILVVGVTITVLLPIVPEPSSYTGRGIELAVAFVLLFVGVAGYLASRFGAGPAEALALAFDPPLRFRWSYNGVQFGGALVGWQLGADIGIATVLIFVLLGPGVDLTSRLLFRTPPTG
jgi:uncharacterized membrane protein YczE